MVNRMMDLDPRLAAAGADMPPSSRQKSPRHLGVERDTPAAGALSGDEAEGETPEDESSQLQLQLQQQQQQGGTDASGVDLKRSRACEACRGLKVRCEPDPDDGPCRRCSKAGRQCIVTAPSRKRQRKTDSRVTDLERKIDALTASLQARGGAGGHHHHLSPPQDSPATTVRARSTAPTSETSRHGSVDRHSTGAGSLPHPLPPPPPSARPTSSSTPSDNIPGFQPQLVTAGKKRKASERSYSGDDAASSAAAAAATAVAAGSGVEGIASRPAPSSSAWFRPQDGDIIERGIITMELAGRLFARFKDRMLPHLPILVCTSGTTFADMRRTCPVLFLAIMTAASSEMGGLQKTLQKELMQTLAAKVFLSADKTLELVQALLVSVIWYCPPDNFEELKFYQLVHTAAVMAIDIGLGRKPAPAAKGGGLGLGGGSTPHSWQNHPFRRHPLPDPTSIEARRTWLACYFMTSNASIALRRPNLVRWTPFMAESVDVLETSPDAAPSDKYLCHLVWTHRLSEEVGAQFSFDDPSATVDLNSPRSQHVLKALERDLDKYRAAVPEELKSQPTLDMGFNMVSLWMHEVVLHNRTAVDQLRPPFNTDTFKDSAVGLEPLTGAQVNAISVCITSAHAVFDTFLALDVPTIRSLPAFSCVRVAYTLVIVVKMYFSASAPGSELGEVIGGKEELKVEYYLDRLQDKFRLVAADDGSFVAQKFIVVLAMLRGWLAKQMKMESKEDTGGGKPSPKATGRMVPPPPPSTSTASPNSRSSKPPSADVSVGQQTQQQQQQQQHHNANTPLQLLSEVAAGSSTSDSSRNHSGGHNVFNNPHIRPVPQPFFYETPPSSSTATATPDTMTRGDFQTPLTHSSSTVHTMPIHSHHHHHQQQQQQPAESTQWLSQTYLPNETPAPGMGDNFDFSSMGYNPDTQSFDDVGMTNVNAAWFNDMVLNLHDPNNLFPF